MAEVPFSTTIDSSDEDTDDADVSNFLSYNLMLTFDA